MFKWTKKLGLSGLYGNFEVKKGNCIQTEYAQEDVCCSWGQQYSHSVLRKNVPLNL